jgi:L-ascorbate metabolism protein UlaG (beta-lactamase superfamily)
MDPLPRLTFLGHSTVLIELGGVRILTDPVLFDRVGPLRRVSSSLDRELHSGIDLAVVSHLHLDHFDEASLRLLGPAVQLVVPAGAGPLLSRLGFERVVELRPTDRVRYRNVSVSATLAAHSGFRPPFGPNAAALGFVFESGSTRIYFAGDTDLFPGMTEIGRGLDVALLPVWGWGPNLGPGHLTPQRAARAVRMLRPRYAIPIHWGTLWPFGFGRIRPGRLTDPPHEFAALAAREHADGRVVVLPPGQPFVVPPRSAD